MRNRMRFISRLGGPKNKSGANKSGAKKNFFSKTYVVARSVAFSRKHLRYLYAKVANVLLWLQAHACSRTKTLWGFK